MSARPIASICCSPPDMIAPVVGALRQPREKAEHGLDRHGPAAPRPQILADREGGKNLALLRHVAEAAPTRR